jgi:hypothetical protein
MKRFILMVSIMALAACPTFAGGGYPYQDNNQAQQNDYYGQNDQAVQTGNYGQQNQGKLGYNNPPFLNPDSDQLYTSEAARKATLAMLYMVYTDLNNCMVSFNQTVKGGISSIGHLNNAQSALRKTVADPAYHSLINEINKRITKIKFYLVMNDTVSAQQRVQQLMLIIKNTLVNDGNVGEYGYNGYNGYNNSGNYGFTNNNQPNTNYPVQHELPISGSGSNITPVVPSFGNGIVPAY